MTWIVMVCLLLVSLLSQMLLPMCSFLGQVKVPVLILTPIFFGAVSGAVVTLTMAGLLSGVGLVQYPLGVILVKALGVGILGAITTPLVFLFGGRLDRMVGNVRMKEESNGFERSTF